MTLTLVTGGANGLGRALVNAAQRRGDTVIAIDTDGAALSALNCRTLELDITTGDAPARLAALGPISLIIHSAGISGTGPFEAIHAAHHARILALNLIAPMRITAALLQNGAMAPRSTHAFVGSLSTYTGYPGAVSYAASKDGLASFARSLNRALPNGQGASVIFPGPLATDHAAKYAPENTPSTVAARQDPDIAAQLILRALSKGRRRIFPGHKAKAFALAGVLAPKRVGRALKQALYDKIEIPKM